MNRQAIYFVLGFGIAGAGLYALIISLVGLDVSYLAWLTPFGGLAAFLGRLVLIMVGATLIVLGTTNWSRERRLIDAYRNERALADVDARRN